MQLIDFIGITAACVKAFEKDSDRLAMLSSEIALIVDNDLAAIGSPFSIGTDWGENTDGYVDFNICLVDKDGNTMQKGHDVRLTFTFDLDDADKWFVSLVVDDKDNGRQESLGYVEFSKGEFHLIHDDIGTAISRLLDVYMQKIKDRDPSRSVGVKFSEENWSTIETVKKHLIAARNDADYNKMRLYEDTDTGYLYLVPEVVVPADGECGLDLSTFPCVGLVHGHFDSATEHLEVISID